MKISEQLIGDVFVRSLVPVKPLRASIKCAALIA